MRLRRIPDFDAVIATSLPQLAHRFHPLSLASPRKHIVVVSTYEEAQLVVEVEGRYRSGTLVDPANNEFWVRLAIKRGPKLSEKQFAAAPYLYQFRSAAFPCVRLGAPGPEAPYWRYDLAGLLSYSATGKGVATLVDDFIAKNYDAMMAPR